MISVDSFSADKPNIVYIMADDLGYAELGCYGQTKIKTPHIDRLAAEGMRMTDAYAGSHVCAPSRSVLMTGLHSGRTPIRANGGGKYYYPSDVTIAEVLKAAGYATGMFGKWGGGTEGTDGLPSKQGFDEFFGQLHQVHAHFYYPYWVWHNNKKYMLPGNESDNRKQYVHDEIHKKAMAFIRANSDRPFFAYLPYIIPHVELVVPEESEIPYRGQFPKVPILDPRPGYIGSEDGFTTLAGMISRLDDSVGEIMALLEELSVADNTIVVFTSDNGGQGGGRDGGWAKMTDFFDGNGGLRGYKGTFYEGGIRVPYVVRWPGRIQPGTQSNLPIGFWDVMPTLAEAAGAEAPEGIDGLSFLPTLTGAGKQARHEYLYWEYPRGNRLQQAVRAGRWKALQPAVGRPFELYDLEADLGETTDLAKRHPEILARLKGYMEEAHTPGRDYPVEEPRPGVADYVR
ncbi:MAG: arylsulfatase [Planctomycetota bacterium]